MLETAKQTEGEKIIVLGFRNSDTFLANELESYGKVYIASEDGSIGTKGNVLDAIRENRLSAERILACGPTPMLRAIKKYAAENNIECFLSLEEKMACGIGVEFKNPVTVASGTFGHGEEFADLVDINRLGAVTTKGVANIPWEGNPTPRIAEVYGGMLNAIGLQNPGVDTFIERDLKFLKEKDTKIIVNVCGRSVEDYVETVERLSDEDVDMFEINISCPNVSHGGIAFGTNVESVSEITKQMKAHSKKPIIMKLSPNVTDITEIARAAEAAGSDALSLINTITGMKIDINKRCFAIANRTGGMSGPAIKPIALRMVYQVANAVKIPIIGMGGIATFEDAVEFMLAGATMVSVGTANFFNPNASIEVAEGIEKYLENNGFKDVNEIIGLVK